jgi:thiamine biosynthesis lipoprotein
MVDNQAGQGEEFLAIAMDELRRVETKFCAYQPNSVISDLNRSSGTGGYTPLDAETRSLLQFATALWQESKHLFDPTTRILQDCYADDGRLLATSEQLQQMLSLVGWGHLEVTENGARLQRKGMLVDLNSCVRPYAVDCARRLLLKHGVSHAKIEMDQDVVTVGRQPDGANWLVGLRHPHGPRTAITRLKLNDGGYAMRGDFERRVTVEGEHFGRGLSPVDGRPVPGLLSVAVTAENCLTACGATSVARLKTEQAALKWLDALGLPWLAIDRELRCHGPLAPK